MTESQRDRNVCYNDGTCILSQSQHMLVDMRAFHVQSIVGPSRYPSERIKSEAKRSRIDYAGAHGILVA